MPSTPRFFPALLVALAGVAYVVGDASDARAEDPPSTSTTSTTSPPKISVSALLKDAAALGTWLDAHHVEVAAADAHVAAVRADVGNAKLIPNPTLDASLNNITLGKTNPSDPRLGFGDTTNFNFGLSETFELGKRGPRVDAAELRLESAKRGREATVADKIGDARVMLGRVVYLRARLAVLEQSLTTAKKVAEIEKVRLDNGGISGVDFDRLILDTMNLEADLQRARADLVSSLATCQGVLYAQCDADGTSLDDLDAAAPIPATPPSPEAAQAKIEQRADIAAIKLESAATKKDAELARARAIPDPNVRVGYTHDNLTIAGNQPNTLGFTLTIPLPIFDHGQHDAAKAEAHARELELQAKAAVVGASTSIDALVARKTFLETATKTLSTTTIPKSASVLDTTSQAFDRGQVSLTDLLIARRTHIALQLNQMDMRFDYFSVRCDLRRALGLDEPNRNKAATP